MERKFWKCIYGQSDDTDSVNVCTAENEDMQPSYEEVTHVIKCLKNHKAPGTDQIIAEFLKKEKKYYGEESTILWNWFGHSINTGRMVYGI